MIAIDYHYLNLTFGDLEMQYYKVTFDTPFGLYDVVVLEETAVYAKQQAREAIANDMHVHLAMVQSKKVVECTGHAKRTMWPLKRAVVDDKQWAWCKKVT